VAAVAVVAIVPLHLGIEWIDRVGDDGGDHVHGEEGDISLTASAAGTGAAVNSQALTFGTNGTLATVASRRRTVEVGEQLRDHRRHDAQAAVTAAQTALDAADTNLTLAQQQPHSPSPSAATPASPRRPPTCCNPQTTPVGLPTRARPRLPRPLDAVGPTHRLEPRNLQNLIDLDVTGTRCGWATASELAWGVGDGLESARPTVKGDLYVLG